MSEVTQNEFEALKDRVEQLESELQAADTEQVDSRLDHYDRDILSGFEDGQTVTLSALREQARRIGLTQKKTIKRRLRRLENIGYLEQTGTQRWRVEK